VKPDKTRKITMEEVSILKANTEKDILTIIQDFEDRTGLTVDHINVITTFTLGSGFRTASTTVSVTV